MIAVMYRWRLKPGMEARFQEAWSAMTEAIAARSGTGGSRLHRTGDGELVCVCGVA